MAEKEKGPTQNERLAKVEAIAAKLEGTMSDLLSALRDALPPGPAMEVGQVATKHGIKLRE